MYPFLEFPRGIRQRAHEELTKYCEKRGVSYTKKSFQHNFKVVDTGKEWFITNRKSGDLIFFVALQPTMNTEARFVISTPSEENIKRLIVRPEED